MQSNTAFTGNEDSAELDRAHANHEVTSRFTVESLHQIPSFLALSLHEFSAFKARLLRCVSFYVQL